MRKVDVILVSLCFNSRHYIHVYHLLKGLLRNKDINEKCKLYIFKIYFKTIYFFFIKTLKHFNQSTQYSILCGAKVWATTNKEDRRIQAMEMKLLRAILNKTKKDRIRNTNIGLELGMDEIKNYIHSLLINKDFSESKHLIIFCMLF